MTAPKAGPTPGPWNAESHEIQAESAANARLIAAAPELAEVLSGLLYWHDEGRHIDESWWDAARTAIAKSRGEA